ncbi:MAG: threonine synthase [Gammaproteobacteria bacterium]
MIKYQSTRAQDPNSYTFTQAILKGLADDGGLLIPERVPVMSTQQLQQLLGKSYQDIAEFVFTLFETDLSATVLQQIIDQAYADNFDDKAITPVVHLMDNQYLLELWHGPTSAFKDLALQVMPLFFVTAAKQENKQRVTQGEQPLHYLILVSTSGDTGKAALEGYKDKENISILAMYPDNRVAFLQERQMVTQEGSNVAVYAVDGDFDAVQEIAKCIFNDKAFKYTLLQNQKTVLSSANSINWGRLMPQIVYYVAAYADLVSRQVLRNGDLMDIVVPTGNFGNILAAFYAKKMGLPIRKLVCAVNENHVLADFLQTGVYDISQRALVKTPSPSMDILIASNIERLLYLLTQNGKQVAQWMHELKEQKRFTVDAATLVLLQENFYADWATNLDSMANIQDIYKKTDYLLDPHTSVAQIVCQRYLQKISDQVPIVICGTAHWSKFARDIYHLLYVDTAKVNDFDILDKIVQANPRLSIPKNIAALKNLPVIHTHKLSGDYKVVENEIVEWIGDVPCLH